MTVTGYLSLYTTLMGWQQYENLWGIVVGSGLIYLPFIGLVLRTTMVPFTSMGAKDAAQIAVRRLSLEVMTALFVIAFAAAPAKNLDPSILHYEPLCTQQAPKEATPGHTGTTYDNMPIPTGVKVPIFWYFVMSVANGVTHAAETGLSCAPVDYRALHSQLNTTTITDPQLKNEIGQYYADCYIPAYSAYIHGQMNPSQDAQIKQSLAKNGPEDIGWMGSQTFLNVSGFYDANRSNKAIPGFAVVPSRDFQDTQVGAAKYGKPDCKSWWADPTNGLHKRLGNTFPPSLVQSLIHMGKDTAQLQDAAIKTLINRTAIVQQPNASAGMRGYESLSDSSGSLLSALGGKVGAMYEGMSFYPKLHLLKNALPVIQGALLFALYTFLALALPFSSFRISFCVTAAIAIFSVIFCSYIWHMVQWFDNYLIQALYGDFNDMKPWSWSSLLGMSDMDPNQYFVNMIIGGMYLVLPLIWLTVMGWAGIQVGNLIAGAITPLAAPAARGGENAKGVAVGATRKIL